MIKDMYVSHLIVKSNVIYIFCIIHLYHLFEKILVFHIISGPVSNLKQTPVVEGQKNGPGRFRTPDTSPVLRRECILPYAIIE